MGELAWFLRSREPRVVYCCSVTSDVCSVSLQALELGVWLRQQYIDTLGFMPASYREGEGGDAGGS